MNHLLVHERRSKILDRLRIEKKIRVKDLKEDFGVSAMTIHRDLKDLESEGLIKCVHGGAVFPEHTAKELLFSSRIVTNADLKQSIAQAAINLVSSGMSIFLDGSTTSLSLARLLKSIPGLSIVTDSLSAFFELQRARGIEVNILGGVLQGDENTVNGPIPKKIVSDMYFDLCFFSAACFDGKGIYNLVPTGVVVKNTAVQQSKKAILLADSTKSNKKGVWKLCDWESISLLITDSKLPITLKNQIEGIGCQIELAKAKKQTIQKKTKK
jgi:DeoR/GlpR family transcriptional regulator of sugar metabolism